MEEITSDCHDGLAIEENAIVHYKERVMKVLKNNLVVLCTDGCGSVLELNPGDVSERTYERRYLSGMCGDYDWETERYKEAAFRCPLCLTYTKVAVGLKAYKKEVADGSRR